MNNETQTITAERESDGVMNRVGGPTVIAATEHLPPEQRNAILWLHSHYWDNNLGLDGVGKLIGYSGAVVSRVFRGKYEGNVGEVVGEIVKFRDLLNERATVNRPPYIETSLYKTLEECGNAARTYQKIGFVFGESQIGKTEGITHYSGKDEYNHGRSQVWTMPVGGSLSKFIAHVCDKLRISGRQRAVDVFGTIASKISPNMLIWIDEAHRAEPGTRGDRTLDFIRAIYDERRPGVVLVGTNVFRDQMANEKFEPFLRQLQRRVLFRRQLPDRPSRADLNMFSRHYGLPAAEHAAYELQRETIFKHGLGVWLTTLAAGSRRAATKRQTMTWEHVIQAHAILKKLEAKPAVED